MTSSYTQCTECGALAKVGEQKVVHQDRLRCCSCGAAYPATRPEDLIAALRARVRELEEFRAWFREQVGVLGSFAASLRGVSEASDGFCWCCECLPESRGDRCMMLSSLLVHLEAAARQASATPRAEEAPDDE